MGFANERFSVGSFWLRLVVDSFFTEANVSKPETFAFGVQAIACGCPCFVCAPQTVDPVPEPFVPGPGAMYSGTERIVSGVETISCGLKAVVGISPTIVCQPESFVSGSKAFCFIPETVVAVREQPVQE